MEFQIQLACSGDAEKIADIHVRSWLFTYSGHVPGDILEKHNAQRSAIWPKLLADNPNIHYVMTLEGRVVGFLSINSARDPDLSDTVYELIGLYLDPDFAGKGLGQRAMDWVKTETAARGCQAVSLWVLDKNLRAKAFYEKNGFKADGSVKESGLGDTKVERYLFWFEK